ncbi:hypothetical protein MSG28_001101 [Choristoneura fumiferana]|uniref:Uncharacterized protein n=1 Tax=Choristoneura fumiferana TaxID=7141 RepID=A0ACC0K3Q5_CHOFU|nr:hypothetical protein MSG28_001101 [Choristoneura fumiferana]
MLREDGRAAVDSAARRRRRRAPRSLRHAAASPPAPDTRPAPGAARCPPSNMHTTHPGSVQNFGLIMAIVFAYLPHADQAAGTGGGGMFGDVNISAILDSLSVSYDKRVRPNYGGPPVQVGVTMYVLSIGSVSEVLMVLATVNSRLSRSLRRQPRRPSSPRHEAASMRF